MSIVNGRGLTVGAGNSGSGLGLLSLEGGLLKGEMRSSVKEALGARFGLCDGARLVTRGLSARFTGGGGPIVCLAAPSRRSSPDLRGGGGSGADGLFRCSNGVCGRLNAR